LIFIIFLRFPFIFAMWFHNANKLIYTCVGLSISIYAVKLRTLKMLLECYSTHK